MSRQLGVEMTVLRASERETLMRGMILRRLRRTLTEVQLGVGLGEDLVEIHKRFNTFDFETYIGVKFEPFLEAMIADGLVTKELKPAEKEGEEAQTEYGPGPGIPTFDAALANDMEWFIDELPMSTRGLFDNLLQNPSRKIMVSADDLVEDHNDGKNRIVEDTRDLHNTKKKHLNDHGLRAGPTGKL